MRDFEEQFYRYLEAEQGDLLSDLAEKAALDDDIVSSLKSAADDFKQTFTA